MHELIILEPVIKDLIWGREYWTVAALKNGEKTGDCTVKKGSLMGIKLSELWKDHRELFGNLKGDEFPLLIKTIDARDDLSIQVHPDNDYAWTHDRAPGKTECWYILDCGKNGSIIIGHNAGSSDELRSMVQNGRWKDLLREIPVKKGDFFQIIPGTIHAIKKNTKLVEIQQSSDTTYRLYDYDRIRDGKKRELHIEKSLDVINVPFKEPERSTDNIDYRLVSCNYYTVDKRTVSGREEFCQDKPFEIISVTEGHGYIDDTEICEGDSVIIPCGYGKYVVSGDLTMLITHV
ncbi:MAG: class I mannose-6-phosphate isomerase [Lachnospiraceae bacterium]|nr:class I mannose-6-phosphate isomerase [Lachnospiraceae bacterium]